MALIILIIEILFLSYVERKQYGFWYTPITLLGYPFLIVCLEAYFFAPSMGFVSLYLPSLWIWVVGIFLFWIVGYLIGHFFLTKGIKERNFEDIDFKAQIKFVKFICFIFSIICIVSVIKLFLKTGGFTSIEYESYLAKGLPGYASIFLRFFCIYFFCTFAASKKWDLLSFIYILLTIGFLVLYRTKFGLILPIIGGIIGYFIIKKIQIKWWHVCFALIFGISIFYISYSLSFGEIASNQFIYKHFSFYLNAGILGFSEHIKLGLEKQVDPSFLFLPFKNVYHKLIGEEIINSASNLSVDIGYVSKPNVKTFFGAIYVYGGALWGSITTIIWASFVYLSLILACKKELIFFVLYLSLAVSLFTGWFDSLYNTVECYLIFLLCFFWYCLKQFINRRNKISDKTSIIN